MSRPFCRRCLLEDMPSEAALAQSIRELIELMPDEQRTTPAQRLERLAVCRECVQLANGTCALCGCYVELRTAKLRQHCPHIPAKW